jgi:hypothetical protein
VISFRMIDLGITRKCFSAELSRQPQCLLADDAGVKYAVSETVVRQALADYPSINDLVFVLHSGLLNGQAFLVTLDVVVETLHLLGGGLHLGTLVTSEHLLVEEVGQ